MARLSTNVNKIATLRNARGKNIPDLIRLTKVIIEAGCLGITVHPRPDARHIRYQDVLDIKKLLENYKSVEFNIEGYPSTQFLDLIKQVKPHQCTLVPDPPDVLTSNAGWDFTKNEDQLKSTVKSLKEINTRSSLFLDPFMMDESGWQSLKNIAPDRIELYTEKYAEKPKNKDILEAYKQASLKAHQLNIKVNAGHDLNQKNLLEFIKSVPNVEEVSIGQSLIAEALEEGLSKTIKKYLAILKT